MSEESSPKESYGQGTEFRVSLRNTSYEEKQKMSAG